MQVCINCGVEYREGDAAHNRSLSSHSLAPSGEQQVVSPIASASRSAQLNGRLKEPFGDPPRRDLLVANATTSVVVGGTAQFVSFLFVLIAQTAVSLLENAMLSSFIGLCLGLTAYAILTAYDQMKWYDRVAPEHKSPRQVVDLRTRRAVAMAGKSS
jgi:hypothetical protein